MAPSREACAVAMAMAAPFVAIASNAGSAIPTATCNNGEKRRRTSSDALQRTVSDVSYELHHHQQHGAKEKEATEAGEKPQQLLHPVPEVEDVKCECCGMSEECTPAYIGAVRRRFSGRWVCGLCAEAVAEEAGKNGGDRDAALAAHMAVCRRFNGFGRTHQALFQADAVIDIVRRLAGSPRLPKLSAGTRATGGGAKSDLAGSSGCVALVAGARNDQVVTN